MKKILIALFFSSIFADDYLVLKTYGNIEGSDLTKTDLESIDMLFSEELEKYGTVETSSTSCADDECAILELSASQETFVVYTKIMKLGSKIIYTGSVLNDESSFTSKVTALSVEDMENAVVRLVKSLALNESIEDVVDIDNIIESEEEESARRQSLGRVGFSIGYMFPTFNSYAKRNYESNDDGDSNNGYEDGSYLESTTYDSQKITIGMNYFYEFKENRALLAEFIWYTGSPASFGADMSMLKYLGKDDFSPFIGGGVGIHWVSYCSGYCYDDVRPEDYRRSGLALNAQGGYVLFRTYNINVIARAKYHLILNTDLDQGFTIDVGLERKPSPKRSADETKLLLQQSRTYYIIAALILALLGGGR
jgi:hypothetical protein